ncbi:MAG: hypothetical protein ABJK28_09295 [Algibacter sp.]
MSLKAFRKKLDLVELVETNAPGMIFKLQGKYYTNTSYSQEVDKSFIQKHNLAVVRFEKQTRSSTSL